MISNISRAALAAVALAFVSTAAAEDDWIAQSNANAAPMLEIIARYHPESVARLGVEGFDEEIVDLKPDYDKRAEADLARVATELEAKLATTRDPRVRQDLQILIDSARDNATTSALERRLMLPYTNLPEDLFRGFQSLLDPRTPKERYPAALVRLRKYNGTEPGYTPITELAQDRAEERFDVAGLTGPWKVEVEQHLENQPRYVTGIRELFENSGLEGWEEDFARLEKQLDDHAAWVSAEILPRARDTNLLPPEIYTDKLRNFGVKADPLELIDRALIGFVQTRDELQVLAGLVAEERGYASSDYRDVLRSLKEDTIANDALLETYRSRLRDVEKMIREHDLITLPDRDAVIRLATEAESASIPAPHLSPPRLIGNTGEPAEFVLPLANPNAAPGSKMDDFNFDAITWTLTAHEARPGHELQFAKMVEVGVSIPRMVFAFNSANVEGWALYAESILKEYLPLPAQMGTLQMRLLRAARAFLDPMVNLGQIEPAAAQAFLMQEVGLSEPMAKQEADRYSFNMPGQATAYFYGYEKQLALRGKVEIALGERFDGRSYHDFIIAQGLVPPELLEQAVMEQYLPARLASAKAASAE